MKSSFVNGAREAFLRGRALQDLERYEESLDWFSYAFEGAVAYLAPSHYYRGQIFEATGDTAQAKTITMAT